MSRIDADKLRYQTVGIKVQLGLNDKRVLVTGASRGIGFAIAKKFLAEGARICLVSRGSPDLHDSREKLSQEFGMHSVLAFECDCTSVNDLFLLRAFIIDLWGGIDIVVCNVGNGASTLDVMPDEEQWQKVWDLNFGATLNTTRTFLPELRKSKGCLLFVSSIAGLEAFGAPVDYSSAKSAVISMAKNMARKVATEVRINVLAPGNVFFKNGSWDQKIHEDPSKVKKMIEIGVPMKRFGTPDEIADAAVFLCSARASFITGSVLVVDGGQTVSY